MSQLDLSHQYAAGARSVSRPPSEMLSRHMDMELEELSNLPSDDALLAEIREILRTADLMSVTKKSVKQELERRFGVNLDIKRSYINSGKSSPSIPLPFQHVANLFCSYRGRFVGCPLIGCQYSWHLISTVDL